MWRLYKYKQQNLSYRTKWEKRFYDNYLINSWLKKIRRQTIIWQRICDFIITKHWARIEIDWKHHYTKWYKAYDKKRDRILFERYWYITFRIPDFDEEKAFDTISSIKLIKRNHMRRLQFIKKNIRDKNIEDIDRERYSYDWKVTIDYYISLYSKEIEHKKMNIPKIEISNKVNIPRVKKINLDPPKVYWTWISLLYKSLSSAKWE